MAGKKLFVDLGSGLGGASEAFMNQPNWIVMRIDNHELVQDVPNTHDLNYVEQTEEVINLIYDTQIKYEINDIVLWASPECKEWSNGYSSKKSTMRRKGQIFIPDYTQLESIMKIKHAINPQYWIVENVMGGVEFINPILGNPQLIFRPWFFWGDFPLFRIDENRKHKTEKDPHSSDPLRYHIRSKIPIGISLSLKNAIENQTTLLDW